jgi:long-chain acyl-CoA synthetase
MLRKEAEKLEIVYSSNADLISRKEIIDFYQKRIDKIQEDFTPYEKVIKFKLISEPFSIQNGMLTNTLKVRRNILIEQYQKEIDEMYSA